MTKRIILFVLVFFFVITIYSFSRQIILSLRVVTRLDIAADSYNRLQEGNRNLKKRLTEVEKDDYIEAQAREKLNLARPNETVVLIPQEEIEKVTRLYQGEKPIESPNWQKWLNLVFK